MMGLIDSLASPGRLAFGAGGLTLIIFGRWLLRAQAVASFLRVAGAFSVLLGLLVAFGYVDIRVSALVDGVTAAIRAIAGNIDPFGGVKPGETASALVDPETIGVLADALASVPL